jgi:hypothetical protein
LLVIEWGKWTDIKKLQNDLMKLVIFFRDDNFRKLTAEAKHPKAWRKVREFLEKNGISIINIGATIAVALI